jgi:hypothetical protein
MRSRTTSDSPMSRSSSKAASRTSHISAIASGPTTQKTALACARVPEAALPKPAWPSGIEGSSPRRRHDGPYPRACLRLGDRELGPAHGYKDEGMQRNRAQPNVNTINVSLNVNPSALAAAFGDGGAETVHIAAAEPGGGRLCGFLGQFASHAMPPRPRLL